MMPQCQGFMRLAATITPGSGTIARPAKPIGPLLMPTKRSKQPPVALLSTCTESLRHASARRHPSHDAAHVLSRAEKLCRLKAMHFAQCYAT